MQHILQNLVASAKRYDWRAVEQGINTLIEGGSQLKENWYGVAKLAMVVGSYRKAIECLYKVPVTPDVKLQLNTVVALISCEAQDEALARLKMLESNFHADHNVLHLKGTLLAQLGKTQEAISIFRQVLEKVPHYGETWLALSATNILSKDLQLECQFLDAEKAIKMTASIDSKASYYSARGKFHWDRGEFEKASEAYTYCAHLKKASAKPNDAYKSQIKTILANIDKINRVIKEAPRTQFEGSEKSTPIFILGLPRSGTTLLEQIISVDAEVTPMGEVNALEMALKPFVKGKLLSEATDFSNVLSADLIVKIRTEYYRLVNERKASTRVIVDKSLSNGRYLPLIKRLFPNAPIVWIKRDELDNAWSIFKTYFSQSLDWSWSIDQIKQMIINENTLIENWLSVDDIKVSTINYEDLVLQPETILPDLFRELGLVYDNNHVKFYKNESFVNTASVNQIRRSLNQDGIGTSARATNFIKKYQNEM